MRYAVAFAFMFGAGPAAAELQCDMQKGRLVCDYSAALAADARQSSQADPELVAALVPGFDQADAAEYDRTTDSAFSEAICSYANTDEAMPGC